MLRLEYLTLIVTNTSLTKNTDHFIIKSNWILQWKALYKACLECQ